MSEEKPTILNWLGFRTPLDTTKARWLGPAISTICILVIIAVAGPTLVQFLKAVWGLGEFTSEADKHTAIRNSGLAAVAVFGLPFLIWRTLVGQQQANIAKQSHITDQINKAVENLGATRNVKNADGVETTEPNLEVRIGGILALERIGKQNPSEHIQIMEILCAYIRENARQQVRVDVALDSNGTPTGDDYFNLRDDIAKTFDVVERRSEKLKRIEELAEYSPNFENADFRGLNLAFRDLSKFDLTRALFQGTALYDAVLCEADLTIAKMQNALIREANLCGANFDSAELQGADMCNVKLDKATSFHRAVLWGTALTGVHCVPNTFSDDQLMNAFGDASTILPERIENRLSLEHWERERVLVWQPDHDACEFREAWRAAQNKIGFDRQTFTLKHPTK